MLHRNRGSLSVGTDDLIVGNGGGGEMCSDVGSFVENEKSDEMGVVEMGDLTNVAEDLLQVREDVVGDLLVDA